MPRMDGLAATRLLAHPAAGAPIDVLVVTTFDLDDVVFAALRAGAAGFLLKSAEPEALVEAVRTVARGQGLISPDVTRRLISEFAASAPRPQPDPRLDTLTPREHDVLMLMARGLSNADIAARAGARGEHREEARRQRAVQARPQQPRPGRRVRLRARARPARPMKAPCRPGRSHA